MEGLSAEPRFAENTREVQHLPDPAYDALLAENIAFLQLYDAGANNTVVECIARATPLLVNPLPAIVEYLGPNYPFYYESLAEAADKAMDLDLIERTHLYLRGCVTRPKLTAALFPRIVLPERGVPEAMSDHSAVTGKSALSLYKLANLWQRRGHPDRAIRGYEAAFRVDVGFVPAYLELAELLLRPAGATKPRPSTAVAAPHAQKTPVSADDSLHSHGKTSPILRNI